MHPNQPGFQNLAQEGDGRPALYVDTTSQSRYHQPLPSVNLAQHPYRAQIRPPELNTGRTSLPGNAPPSPPYTTASTSSTSAHVPFSPDGAPTEPEKRKRSRVTPAQLARLEELFASDRSPTVSRRKEISAELGMRERQTQIWFQNRRAKAKVQEGRGKPRSKKTSSKKAEAPASTASPATLRPNSGEDSSPNDDEEVDEDEDAELRPLPPEHPRYPSYLARRFDESGTITPIPCRSLKIGPWRTVPDAPGGRELVTYAAQRHDGTVLVVVWYFRERDQSFKMEIPSLSIQSAQIVVEDVSSTRVATARLRVSRKPIFYHHQPSLEGAPSAPPNSEPGVVPFWMPCADFTQGGAVSSTDLYELEGPSHTMVAALRTLPGFASMLSQPFVTLQSGPPSGAPIHAPTPVVPISSFTPLVSEGSMAHSYPAYVPVQLYTSGGGHQEQYAGYPVDSAATYQLQYSSPQRSQQAHAQPRLILPIQAGSRIIPQAPQTHASPHSGTHLSPLSSIGALSNVSPQISQYLSDSGRTYVTPSLNRPYFQDPQASEFQEGHEHFLPPEATTSYMSYSQEDQSSTSSTSSVYMTAQGTTISDAFLGGASYSQPYAEPSSHVDSPITAGYSSANNARQSAQTVMSSPNYEWTEPVPFDSAFSLGQDLDPDPRSGPNAR